MYTECWEYVRVTQGDSVLHSSLHSRGPAERGGQHPFVRDPLSLGASDSCVGWTGRGHTLVRFLIMNVKAMQISPLGMSMRRGCPQTDGQASAASKRGDAHRDSRLMMHCEPLAHLAPTLGRSPGLLQSECGSGQQ